VNSKFLRALIPSEINFAVEDKETALKIEKQMHPETPSYFFTSTFHSRCFSGTDMDRVSIQRTYYSSFSPQHPITMKNLLHFHYLKFYFLGEL
jgi:hypothetical protein